ncbi:MULTISPECIES: GAF domain-containing SpoIIE family protein phosphatase [unclassified Streptomyces]|uniref:GAF domain-containing SpoIIE family protein phosphatase n=1 Tax=unclassified Streptomyces TaxID=2593676 RepID=UPI000AFDCFA7|nr:MULTISPECIES: SpoIIE family protein phosphatase [unclassified Streptomyces]
MARSGDSGPFPAGKGPGRLTALRETGLTAAADAGMDRFARLVTDLVGVPVALVSLVEAERQVFPGMVGLDEPWAEARQTPLTHSLCQHVVASGEPLVLADAREEPLTCGSLAIPDLGVVAYAGMPLVDMDGHVLGSLCAIDTRPRQWSARELGLLEDLAAACSAELRLRIVSRQRERALADMEGARARAGEAAARYRTALDRSQLLLRAAESLADTTGLTEVRQQVRDLITGDLKPTYVGLVVVEDRGVLRRLVDSTGTALMERAYENYGLDAAWPTARAARENRTIKVDGLEELRRDYAPEAAEAFIGLGLRSAVCVPLPGTVIPLGTLVLGWDHHHEIDVLEQAVLTALAGYTARAVERALFVDNRVKAARQMQEALLTTLPEVPGLELAALYRPAASDDLVGGDWYDAYTLPAAARDGEDSAAPAALAVSVGDITGHDMKAATLMGQVRNMLRQADLDHADHGPARAVSAFEHANTHLRLGASGTLVHAHLSLRPEAGDGSWELIWTNAGHLPPLLALPDGSVERLDQHGIMLFPGLSCGERTEHRRLLAPGSLLLLYTDGLVEHPGTDLFEHVDAAARLLAEDAGLPLDRLLKTLADRLVGDDAQDDVALLALRIPSAAAGETAVTERRPRRRLPSP